jgi:hypothetical protein
MGVIKTVVQDNHSAVAAFRAGRKNHHFRLHFFIFAFSCAQYLHKLECYVPLEMEQIARGASAECVSDLR